MSVRRGWMVALPLIATMVMAPAAIRAQTDTTAITHTTTTTTDDDDSDFPWGLLGLLGLLGLIPRKGRDVHVHDTTVHRTVPPRDDRIDPTPPPRV